MQRKNHSENPFHSSKSQKELNGLTFSFGVDNLLSSSLQFNQPANLKEIKSPSKDQRSTRESIRESTEAKKMPSVDLLFTKSVSNGPDHFELYSLADGTRVEEYTGKSYNDDYRKRKINSFFCWKN